MTNVDWLALGLIGLAALSGLRRGLVATALSLAGLIVGAILGSRVAPTLLPDSVAQYSSFVAIGGAVIGAGVLHAVASFAGSIVRGGLRIPGIRQLDSLGGAVVGAAMGAAVVWVLAAAALQIPHQPKIHAYAVDSKIASALVKAVPPGDILHRLAKLESFPKLSGAPGAPAEAPNPAILRATAVRHARASVVRVEGRACGLDVAGSGWTVGPGIVVTAAHVVAGESRTTVQRGGAGRKLRARVVVYDTRNDIAILLAPGLLARSLPLAEPTNGAAVAILGFPGNRAYSAVAGRIGHTQPILSQDSYGKGPTLRELTSVGGKVRHGNSGGPAVDSSGHVQATIFGQSKDGAVALGVPASVVKSALARIGSKAVATGRCAG
jgi:S1-C subfamily serine protease